MNSAIGLGLFYLGIIVIAISYMVRQRRKRIDDLEASISELRKESGRLEVENTQLKEAVYQNVVRKKNKHIGIDIENCVIITNPDEMDRFAREIDGRLCNSIAIKLVIDKQKREMFDALEKFLSLTKPSMRSGSSFIQQ